MQCLIMFAAVFLLAATVSGEAPEVVVWAPATTPLLASRGGPAPATQPALAAQPALLALGTRAAVSAIPPALVAKEVAVPVTSSDSPLVGATSATAAGAAETLLALGARAAVSAIPPALVAKEVAVPATPSDSPLVGATSATAAGAAETLRVLDADHSGSLGSAEIEAFAKGKGVDVKEVKAEFASLDMNGNGALEAAEIANTLAEPDAAGNGQHPSTSDSDASTMDERHPVDLMTSIERRASRGAAEIFARKAATSLTQRAREGTAAEDLEALARSLRANATMLSRGAPAAAALAASAAAKKVLERSMLAVNALTTKADADAHKAAAQRRKADAAMQRALRAQVNMTSSVGSFKGSFLEHD